MMTPAGSGSRVGGSERIEGLIIIIIIITLYQAVRVMYSPHVPRF
jgi:hypothetical protein